MSPNDPSIKWPLDKVLDWLAINGFSNDWQETFKGLHIRGSDFLDLGRGTNGRANIGMMHQLIYPRLARECGKSGSGWNQDRERNEGRRMRRLVRKLAEGSDEGASATSSHVRRESATTAPSASTDGDAESSPSQTPHPDSFSNTPSAIGGEESPRAPFRSPPGLNPRMNSKTRSNTAPAESGLMVDISKSGSNRSNASKGILNNINDAVSKRHSPSPSEVGTGSFISIRGSHDSSPKSGSPSTQHTSVTGHIGNGALSAPNNIGRGHRKNNSSDSMASNQTSSSTANILRDRRNGYDGSRPSPLDVVNKFSVGSSGDTPTSALSKGFLERFRKRKKEDSSHPSPEEQRLESPTSPLNYRVLPPTLPFAQKNGSSTSLERPGSASTQMSEQERIRQRDRDLTRSGGGRRFAFVTPDQWNYRLVDITDADTADAVREVVCRSLNYLDHEMALIYVTEPGQVDHDEPLTDAGLMVSRHTKGDSHGSLKFYVRRGPTSASLAPPSAGLGIGMSPKASPPAGSIFPRKALDDDSYARIWGNAQARPKSPPLTSRQNTIKGDDATPKDNTPKALKLNDGKDAQLTESPPETAKERFQSMSIARKSGTISESEWGSYLITAIEEYRIEMERQGKESQLGRLAAGQPSPNRLSTGGSRVINFDDPNRGSPYDRASKPEPLVPLRKPPAPPPGSVMLEKANSLTRRQGESLRSSIASQNEVMNRLSRGESVPEETQDQARRGSLNSTSAGAVMTNASDAVVPAGKPIGSRPNLPLRDTNERNQTEQAVTLPKSGRSLGQISEASQMSGNALKSKFNASYNLSDSPKVATTNGRKPSLALQTQVSKAPANGKAQTAPERSVNPGFQDRVSRQLSTASRPKSYGPNFAFKESEVTFEQKPPLPSEEEPDDDSDEGLFAKPLVSRDQATKPGAEAAGGEDSSTRRPTLKVDTDTLDQRRGKTRSVTFRTPDTSTTTASTAQSSDTPDLDSEGHPRGKISEEKQSVFPSNRTPSSTVGSRPLPTRSPDSIAASIARRQSFARDDVWANRPPTEDLLNNLDAFFPNLDLDQPVVEDLAGSPPVSPETGTEANPLDQTTAEPSGPSHLMRSSLYDRVRPDSIRPDSIAEEPENGTLGSQESTLKGRTTYESALPSVAQRNVRKSGGLGRMKSIRDVARGAYEGSSKRNTRISTGPAMPLPPVKSSDIVRRKSTKMFGANIVQIKPQAGTRVSLIEPVPKDLPPGTNSFQIGRGQLIGKGSYGRVYLGINLTTGDFLAVKQVEVKKAAGQDDEKMKEMVAALDQEIDTMQHLEHPNIVQYLGCERKDFAISIFLEYISGGSVGSCLRKHGKFEESLVSSLTRQTLAGLAYLHQEGVLHRDLKADNILLDTNGTCKISDFGISKKTDNIYGNDVTNSMQGSVFWMAPEVIRSQGQGYSAKVDIWSLGCVVLEMFAGRRPWSKEEAIGAIYKLGSLNQAPPIPDDVSSSISAEAVAFMLDCFTVDPSERPTAATLLREHPFCRGDPYYNFLDTELHAKLEEANRGVRYEGQS